MSFANKAARWLGIALQVLGKVLTKHFTLKWLSMGLDIGGSICHLWIRRAIYPTLDDYDSCLVLTLGSANPTLFGSL